MDRTSLVEQICNENFVIEQYTKVEPQPIIQFNAKQLLKDGPFDVFHYRQTWDMDEDITLIDGRETINDNNAWVVPLQGALPDRDFYVPRKELRNRNHMGTYVIGNAIGWDIRKDGPPSIPKLIEILLQGFKDKIHSDATGIVVAAAQKNEAITLESLKKLIAYKHERRIDTLFFDEETETRTKHFGIEKLMPRTECILDKEHLNKYLEITGQTKPGYKAIIAAAIQKSNEKFGTHSKETPFVIAERGIGKIFLDTTRHRDGKLALYGWMNIGIACFSEENVGIVFVKNELYL